MYGLTVNQFIKIARCKRSLKLQGQQFTPFCANMTATFIPRPLPDVISQQSKFHHTSGSGYMHDSLNHDIYVHKVKHPYNCRRGRIIKDMNLEKFNGSLSKGYVCCLQLQ